MCLWVSLKCRQVCMSWWVCRRFACLCVYIRLFPVCISFLPSFCVRLVFVLRVWVCLCSLRWLLFACDALRSAGLLFQCWALARAGTGRGRSEAARVGSPLSAWRKWCSGAKTTDQVIITNHLTETINTWKYLFLEFRLFFWRIKCNNHILTI